MKSKTLRESANYKLRIEAPNQLVSALLARPSLGHRLVSKKSKIFIFSFWPRVDIRNNCAHPLQVVGVVGRTKQLGIGIQRIKNFDHADASAGEKIRLSGDEILAAAQVKIGGKNPCCRLRPGLGFRSEQCQRDRKTKPSRSHLKALRSLRG